VVETRENYSETGQKECSETQGDDRINMRIVRMESWIRDEIWSREPTVETVERLIEWFSDEGN
jgi:hypothetical protein